MDRAGFFEAWSAFSVGMEVRIVCLEATRTPVWSQHHGLLKWRAVHRHWRRRLQRWIHKSWLYIQYIQLNFISSEIMELFEWVLLHHIQCSQCACHGRQVHRQWQRPSASLLFAWWDGASSRPLAIPQLPDHDLAEPLSVHLPCRRKHRQCGLCRFIRPLQRLRLVASNRVTPRYPGWPWRYVSLRLANLFRFISVNVMKYSSINIGPLACLEFSTNGNILASGSWDGTLKIWDVYKNTCLETFEHGCDVLALAFRPDSKQICTATTNGNLTFWDPESGNQIKVIEGEEV